jgi:hypothetical protein
VKVKNLKVKDLIEKLQSFDPELMIVISGYEGGVDEAEYAIDVSLKLNVHTEWYYGKHEVVECETMPIDCNAIYIH